MTDIKTIPDADLEYDLRESLLDIKTCELALLAGVTTYGDKPDGYVERRLKANQDIVKAIKAEQKRRKEVIQ